MAKSEHVKQENRSRELIPDINEVRVLCNTCSLVGHATEGSMPVSLPNLANISALNFGSLCLSLSSRITPTYGNCPFKIRRSGNLKTLFGLSVWSTLTVFVKYSVIVSEN